MKIASVTPIYNSEFFLRPFLKQISVFDENIILLGEKPFEDYLAAGLVKKERDKSWEILQEYSVRIWRHRIKFYSGQLFNLGLDLAKSIGCDVVVKIDPDMFLEKSSMDSLLDTARNLTAPALNLNMAASTIVYEQDFDHGVSQSLWHVGGEPFIIDTHSRFIEDGTNISVEGSSELEIPEFVIHHFSGFKRPDIISEVEKLPKFSGWTSCPEEIRRMFKEEYVKRGLGNQ